MLTHKVRDRRSHRNVPALSPLRGGASAAFVFFCCCCRLSSFLKDLNATILGDGVERRDVTWPSNRMAYHNDDFETYYKAQGVVGEGEWSRFLETLKTPLPLTFRLSRLLSARKRTRLLRELRELSARYRREGHREDLSPVSFVPSSGMWQLPVSCDRDTLRFARNGTCLADVRKWCARERGRAITWQEAVSVVPALALRIEREHDVLDMCAAPGSKTTAMLESRRRIHSSASPRQSGVVVANDLDKKRGHVLTHQCKRVGSDALIVTHTAAQNFPCKKAIKFDRIMCDVPCTGDGTLRKEPSIWSKWCPKNALALHPIQLAIALRGARLLKIGGRMAYSTCSFNPIENEAVVSAVLRATNGALTLVDTKTSGLIPLLRRRPGLRTWTVFQGDMTVVEDRSASAASHIPETVFPPTHDELDRFRLNRCMRLVPHDQNTGGFFVAIFQKTSKWSDKTKRRTASDRDDTDTQCFRPFEKKEWNAVERFYGITDVSLRERIFTRASGRSVHLVSAGAARFLRKSSTSRVSSTWSVVHAGVKCVERCGMGPNGDVGCGWRLCQDGISTLIPYMDRSRVVRVDARTLLNVLERLPSNLSTKQWNEQMKTRTDRRDYERIPIRELSPHAQRTVAHETFRPGCFVLALEHARVDSIDIDVFATVAWLAGGRKQHFSVAHAGLRLQSRLESIKVDLRTLLSSPLVSDRKRKRFF